MPPGPGKRNPSQSRQAQNWFAPPRTALLPWHRQGLRPGSLRKGFRENRCGCLSCRPRSKSDDLVWVLYRSCVCLDGGRLKVAPSGGDRQFKGELGPMTGAFTVGSQAAAHFFGRIGSAVQAKAVTVLLGRKTVIEYLCQIFFGNTH